MFIDFLKWGWNTLAKRQICISPDPGEKTIRGVIPSERLPMLKTNIHLTSALSVALNSVPGSRAWAIHAVIVEQTLIHHGSRGLYHAPIEVLTLAAHEMSMLSRIEPRHGLQQLFGLIKKIIEVATPSYLHVELDVLDPTNMQVPHPENDHKNDTVRDKHNEPSSVGDDGFPDTESFPHEEHPSTSPPADRGLLFDALEKSNSWRCFH